MISNNLESKIAELRKLPIMGQFDSRVPKICELVEEQRHKINAEQNPFILKLNLYSQRCQEEVRCKIFFVSLTEIYLTFSYFSDFRLGDGSFSKVTKAVDYSREKEVAFSKSFVGDPKNPQSTLTPIPREQAEKEIKILQLFSGINQINQIGIGFFYKDKQKRDRRAIVTECCNYETLFDFSNNLFKLEQELKVKKDEIPQIKKGIALDILRGLVAIHSKGICHLDFASPNILLHRDETGKILAKICDFGFASQRENTAGFVNDIAEFQRFAPEMLRYYLGQKIHLSIIKEDMQEKIDVWGAGVCLHDLFYEDDKLSWIKQGRWVLNVKRAARHLEKMWEFHNSNYKNDSPIKFIIWQMLHPDPLLRITAKDALDQFEKLIATTE